MATTWIRKTLVATAGLALSAGVASAQPAGLTFAGTAVLCFYASGDPACTPMAGGDALGGLTYVDGAFSVATDASGFAAIGGLTNNLGILELDSSPNFDYNGWSFRMFVDITAPPTVPGGFNYQGDLTGSVVATGNGVSLNFDEPRLLPFSFNYEAGPLAGYAGTGTLEVPDFVSVNADELQSPITARLHATVVPEPATVLLLGSGLAGLGLVGLRNRRRSTDLA